MHGPAVILGWATCAAFTGPVLVEPLPLRTGLSPTLRLASRRSPA